MTRFLGYVVIALSVGAFLLGCYFAARWSAWGY